MWHIVINTDGKILAVYGANLKSEADAMVERLGHLFARVARFHGKRPYVGEFIGNLRG